MLSKRLIFLSLVSLLILAILSAEYIKSQEYTAKIANQVHLKNIENNNKINKLLKEHL